MAPIYFTPKASTALLNAVGFPGALHPWQILLPAPQPNALIPLSMHRQYVLFFHWISGITE